MKPWTSEILNIIALVPASFYLKHCKWKCLITNLIFSTPSNRQKSAKVYRQFSAAPAKFQFNKYYESLWSFVSKMEKTHMRHWNNCQQQWHKTDREWSYYFSKSGGQRGRRGYCHNVALKLLQIKNILNALEDILLHEIAQHVHVSVLPLPIVA